MPRGRRGGRKGRAPDAEAEQRPSGPRAMWSGTITFGLVSIPVDLFPGQRSSGVRMRTLDAKGRPLQRRYRCPVHDRLIDDDEIVRGYPVGGDQYVEVTDEELEGLAPDRSRDIDLRQFVPRDQLDPMLLERSYFLVPAGGSTKPYQLLANTMEETHRAGVATFVMRGKEYLVAILAEDGVLRAHTLRYHDEVRGEEQMNLPELPAPKPARVKELTKAIESMRADELYEEEMQDERTAALMELARAKQEEGRDVVRAPAGAKKKPVESTVVDLMQALKQRLQAADARATSSGSNDAEDDLSEATREELYERAKELDIPGRSKMSKDELIEAISRKSA